MALATKTHKLRTVPVFGATILLTLTGLYFNKGYYEQSFLYKTSQTTNKIITQKIDESWINERDVVAQSYKKDNKEELINEGMKATFVDTWNANVEELSKTLIKWVS